MLKKNARCAGMWLATCAATVLFSAGCRSMPGRNMFGMRTKPSAEALAGNGPTTTYPAPPSESSTPQVIASVAGGTATPPSQAESETAQVAGIEISPGYATPASTVPANMAAAELNGVYAGSSTKPVDYEQPQAKPSGYTFGSKALTPKTAATSPYAKPSPHATAENTPAPPAVNFAPPSTSYTKPPAANPGGFTLPADSPAVAAISEPPSAASAVSMTFPEAGAAPVEVSLSANDIPQAAPAPEFSTASAAKNATPSGSLTSPASVSVSSGGGYMPGSTATDYGYPTGNVAPTTQGSFYR